MYLPIAPQIEAKLCQVHALLLVTTFAKGISSHLKLCTQNVKGTNPQRRVDLYDQTREYGAAVCIQPHTYTHIYLYPNCHHMLCLYKRVPSLLNVFSAG